MKKFLALLSFLIFGLFFTSLLNTYANQSKTQSAINTNTQLLYSDLNRTTVTDSQHQYVGRISDIVINPDGRISFAIVSPLWTQGVNERLLALPFDALSFNNKYLVLDANSDQLVNAPIFHMNYLNARNWAEDTNRYFGVQPSWGEGSSCKNSPETANPLPMTKGWNRPYAASEIVGTQVKDDQGEFLGKVKDLVFDKEGRISFAVLGYGGFLGIGQNLVAVPITSLSYVKESRYFAMNTTKENIQSAPLFGKQALNNPNWTNDDYRYFGQQPYWTQEK